jgi:hypothetical protein
MTWEKPPFVKFRPLKRSFQNLWSNIWRAWGNLRAKRVLLQWDIKLIDNIGRLDLAKLLLIDRNNRFVMKKQTSG